MRIGTLFSGGLAAPEQALKQIGRQYTNVFACEWDKFARENYLANHNIDEGHFHKDICDMDGGQYRGKVDIIIGGSPCQDFSIAGLREGVEGRRGQLIWEYFRIIDEVKPLVFIYENVKGMVSDNNGKTLKDFLEVFRSIGYHCHAEVLNTKDYGIPQNRERIYIIGFQNHEHYYNFKYEQKQPLIKRLKDMLEEDVDEKYYINNKKYLKFISDETRIKKKYVQHDGEVAICQQARQYASWSGDFITEPKIIQRPRGYDKGGEHEICPTISSCSWEENNLSKEAKIRLRKLTPRECFRLQGCNDSFKIVVSNSQAYKIAGNGMSVNVLEMLFKQIEKAQIGKTNTLMDFAS